jgi:hypothetical protein
MIGIAIVVVVLVGVLVVASVTSASRAAQVSATPVASALGQCGSPECGQANAPVTIEIYSDFQ